MIEKCGHRDGPICRHPVVGSQIVNDGDCAECGWFNPEPPQIEDYPVLTCGDGLHSPQVSTVGTAIRKAIEIATKTQITCGGCLAYLRGLDRVTDHDIDTVTNGLLAQLALPVEFRKQLGGIPAQRVWLRVIVQRVIVEAPS